MESGANKSLFTLLAIVIFGVFISLSYFLFQDQLRNVLADVTGNMFIVANNIDSPDHYGDNYFAKPTRTEKFTYTTVSGEIKLTSYTGTSKSVVVPYEIDGKPVTTIAPYTFYNKGLTSLILPDTIKVIEASVAGADRYKGAFAYNQLTEVELPEGLEVLGQASFYNNPLLEKVTFPSTLKVIGFDSFSENNIKEAILPEGLTTINGYAFNSCNITNLVIPNSVTKIDENAFRSNLIESLTLGTGLTKIGNYAFFNNKLTTVTVPNKVTLLEPYVFAYNLLTAYNLPTSLQAAVTATPLIIAKDTVPTYFSGVVVHYY